MQTFELTQNEIGATKQKLTKQIKKNIRTGEIKLTAPNSGGWGVLLMLLNWLIKPWTQQEGKY